LLICIVGEIGVGFFKTDTNLEKLSTKPTTSLTNRFADGLENGEKKHAEEVINFRYIYSYYAV
jgi:hypothetical protein